MTRAERLRVCADICRRAADRCLKLGPTMRLFGPSGDLQCVALDEVAGQAFHDAAALITAVAEERDGDQRMKAVADLNIASDNEQRSAAWMWVGLIVESGGDI